jgi:uncharacterized protein (TIGR02147 family)
MAVLQQFSSCSEILKAELTKRQLRNSSYSMRAFARDLDLSPSHLSEAMSGNASRLSPSMAESIAARLRWEADDRQYFIDLAVMASSKNALWRDMASSRIEIYRSRQTYTDLDAETFGFISDWYHLAIVELSRLDAFEPSAGWIAAKLGLTDAQVITALAKLERLGLVRFEDDEFTVAWRQNAVPTSPKGQEGIRAFHRQMLAKASAAIDEQDVDERDLAAMIIATDSSRVPEFAELLKKMRRELTEQVKASTTKRDALYGLCVQWFKLTRD